MELKMKINRHKLLFTGVAFVSVLNIAATLSSAPEEKFQNLQVLPKNISSKDLQSIMVDQFQDGLGVGCGYCHAQKKGSLQLDYASDEKPEKKIARKMMRMTMAINKKYFEVDQPLSAANALSVSCYTCHKGVAHPEPE